MDKQVRKAVRCYVIKNSKVVAVRYKKGMKKEDYYDIPGGKIEDGETPEQAALREMKEETGLNIYNLKHKGNMIIEYPDRIYDFDVFTTNESQGVLQENEENISEWIEIEELLQKEKILSNIIILKKEFIKGLIDDKLQFNMHIMVDEQENILDVKYDLN